MSHEEVVNWLWRAPVITFIVIGACEMLAPRGTLLMPAGRRWIVNFGMWVATLLCSAAFIGGGLIGAGSWAEANGWGVLRNSGCPYWLQWAVGFLIYDFTSYWQHRASHQFRLLWRLHHVHHTDPDCDLMTAFRFHPGEVLAAQAVMMGVIVVLGPPMSALVASLLLMSFTSFATHANVQLPERVDRVLSWILITPDAHHTHHSVTVEHQMGNYAPVFSIWDRMWGTYVEPVREIEAYGVREVDPETAVHLPSMLMDPFVGKFEEIEGGVCVEGGDGDGLGVFNLNAPVTRVRAK